MKVVKYRKPRELAGWDALARIANDMHLAKTVNRDFHDFESIVLESDETTKTALARGGYLIYKDIESERQYGEETLMELRQRIVFIIDGDDNLIQVIVFDYQN